MNRPNILFTGMNSWYLNHTAREAHALGCLAGYWMGNKRPGGIPLEQYRRIWPYHLAQKPFYHLPFVDLEERMRWINLPFYDAWMRFQKIPDTVNVVQAPMGSCEALFDLADRSGNKILKVFDAPNSHPNSLVKIWQKECDEYCEGYKIPFPRKLIEKILREIKRADLILCPSIFVKDSMVENGVESDKCFVSHFGVDTSIFKPRLTLPSKPRFICVGSLTVRKGQQYLLPAFLRLKKIFPDAELICVGGLRPDFKNEILKWQGQFQHIPSVNHEELAELLSTCTAFILPSLEEGFARVLSEAMAAGLPILASHESGASTIINHGCEGLIIKSRDVDSIFQAMKSMIDNPDQNCAMGKASYEVGARSNSWADYTKRLLSEYKSRLNK